MRRESWRRWAVRVGAVLAIPLAVFLVVLSVDVLRVPGNLAADDTRFQVEPQAPGLWSDLGFVPGGIDTGLLGLQDDVAYRRTLALFLRVQPGKVQIYGPVLENLVGQVQNLLGQGADGDPDRKRRSVLLNLRAAMALNNFTSDQVQNEVTLRNAIESFRTAIDLDPTNDDAKVNLELALRNAKAVDLPGTGPDSGSSQGKVSGQGSSGTGY